MKESTFAFLMDLDPDDLSMLADGHVPEKIKTDAETIQRAACVQRVADGGAYPKAKR